MKPLLNASLAAWFVLSGVSLPGQCPGSTATTINLTSSSATPGCTTVSSGTSVTFADASGAGHTLVIETGISSSASLTVPAGGSAAIGFTGGSATGDPVNYMCTQSQHTDSGVIWVTCVGCSATYPTAPGTDYRAAGGTNETPYTNGTQVYTGKAGDLFSVDNFSPMHTYDLVPLVLAAQVFPTGFPPPSISPFVHLNLGAFVLVNGAVGPIYQVVAPSGSRFHFLIPPGFAGSSVLFQSFAMSALAPNGVFAPSNGVELRIIP